MFQKTYYIVLILAAGVTVYGLVMGQFLLFVVPFGYVLFRKDEND